MKTIILARTNIVCDYPAANGYIYKKSALLDLVSMNDLVNGTNGYIIDKRTNISPLELLNLLQSHKPDFKLKGFELINDELAALIEFPKEPAQLVVHPIVASLDTINEDKVINSIQKLLGIVSYKSEVK